MFLASSNPILRHSSRSVLFKHKLSLVPLLRSLEHLPLHLVWTPNSFHAPSSFTGFSEHLLGCRCQFISFHAIPLDPNLLLNCFFLPSRSFVLMSPQRVLLQPLKITVLCYSWSQNSISCRALITVHNWVSCFLLKCLSSSLDCKLSEGEDVVWVEQCQPQGPENEQ